MDKVIRIGIGIVSFLPFLYIAFFLTEFYTNAGTDLAHKIGVSSETIWDSMRTLHLGCLVVTVGICIGFVTFLFRTESVSEGKKPLWAIVIVLGTPIAAPIFWFWYLKNSPSEIAANRKRSPQAAAEE